MSTRRWLIAVALMALILGLHVALVEAPARSRRFRRSDQLVRFQIDLYCRAAAAAQKHEREDLEIAAHCKELAQSEEKAAKGASTAEERKGHSDLSALYAKSGTVHEQSARRSADRARTFRQTAANLLTGRDRTEGDLVSLERMAKATNTLMSRLYRFQIPSELRPSATADYVEAKARDGLRTSFPTIAGPRQSAIEAAAIWGAEQFLRKTQPGISLKGYQVEAIRPSSNAPFWWTVRFTDPATGQNHEVHTGFGPSVVDDYVARNP
jgi:hypothetical protein